MSLYSFLLIAYGGDTIRPAAWPMNDGGHAPVIERLHRGEEWWPLVSWDDLRMSLGEATAHAQRCIDRVRQEAVQKAA